MAVTQLSVAVTNAPGKAAQLLGVLARAKIDVRAVTVAENADLGVVRMVVSEVTRAKNLLKKKGIGFSADPVVAIALGDKPGALSSALSALSKKNINVEYLYGTTCVCSGDKCGCGPDGCDCVIVLRVKDTKAAEAALKKAKIKIVKP